MLTGLLHAHKYLGYLTFLLAFVGVALTLAGAGRDAGKAALLSKVHRLGFLTSGRLNLVLGITVVLLRADAAGAGVAGVFAHWGWWAGALVWGGIEPIAKRMVQGELAAVQGGGTASKKLLIGTVLEVVLLTAVVGIMTMTRLGKL